MKSSIFIPAVLLSLTSVDSHADDFTCRNITGTIQQLVPDENPDHTPACHILQVRPQHLPDETFFFDHPEILPPPLPATCFYSPNVTATFGNTPVSGIAYSGLTVNRIGHQFSAATAIRLYAGPVDLGKIVTTDIIIDPFNPPTTKERLTMVSGTKTFNDGHGHLEITGNALAGPTNFSGVLCIEN